MTRWQRFLMTLRGILPESPDILPETLQRERAQNQLIIDTARRLGRVGRQVRDLRTTTFVRDTTEPGS